MNKYSSIEAINASSLSDQTKFKLNEIIKIEDYFNSEIQERNVTSKKIGKYMTAFDCLDKPLIVLSATSGGISIISFATVTGVPAGIASASFTVIFSLTTRIIKKVLKISVKIEEMHRIKNSIV